LPHLSPFTFHLSPFTFHLKNSVPTPTSPPLQKSGQKTPSRPTISPLQKSGQKKALFFSCKKKWIVV
ncbi:MAG: hypothetical protein R3Y45_08970, partial [Bacillota bacterium]